MNYTSEDVEALVAIQQKKYKNEPLQFMPTIMKKRRRMKRIYMMKRK
jgi:hypothetical protein